MQLAYKKADEKQPYLMEDHVLTDKHGNAKLRFYFDDETLLFNADYFYPMTIKKIHDGDSIVPELAARKSFGCDGFLKRSFYFSPENNDKKIHETSHSFYQYRNGRLINFHEIQNGQHNATRPKTISKWAKLFLPKDAQEKENQKFHDQHAVYIKDLIPDFSDNARLTKQVDREVKKAFDYNKKFLTYQRQNPNSQHPHLQII